jgi:ATP-dependent protease ClpP protease subunit
MSDNNSKVDNIYLKGDNYIIYAHPCSKEVDTDEGTFTSDYMKFTVDLLRSVKGTGYETLCTFLRNDVTTHDEITLALSNTGGCVDAGYKIINALRACEGKITCRVEAPCYSMGAILAIAGDKLIMEKNTFLMFHNYSGMQRGKGQEALDMLVNTDEWIKEAFKSVCTPFLTAAEMNKIFDDKDVYIHDSDKDINTRIKRHFK